MSRQDGRKWSTNLLELLDGTLVDTTAFVDQVWSRMSATLSLRRSRNEGHLRPVVVDFPESTWPMTTTLMWNFSLLRAQSVAALVPF
jgi:hypothetical protein